MVNRAQSIGALYVFLHLRTGYYEFVTILTEGSYNIIAQKEGYDDAFDSANITFENTTAQINMTLLAETPGQSTTIIPHVHGYITDTSGVAIYGADVSISGSAASSVFRDV